MLEKPDATWYLPVLAFCFSAPVACMSPYGGTVDGSRPATAACGPDGAIEDGEDGDAQGLLRGGRSGKWYTYADATGSIVNPATGDRGGVLLPSPGGANGSRLAMRCHGQLSQDPMAYAGMGMHFLAPKGLYDATAYQGVTLWLKVGPGSASKVRVQIPDVNTDPDGGVCSAECYSARVGTIKAEGTTTRRITTEPTCYNAHGRTINATNGWTQYYFEFDWLSQESRWGSPRRGSLDATSVFSLEFQAEEKGEKFDISVDEVAFTGCR